MAKRNMTRGQTTIYKTLHWNLISNNTTGATNGTGIAYSSGAHEYILVFSGVRVDQSFASCGTCIGRFPYTCILKLKIITGFRVSRDII
jgi:hypothetical protein